jgi:hypothetical protein
VAPLIGSGVHRKVLAQFVCENDATLELYMSCLLYTIRYPNAYTRFLLLSYITVWANLLVLTFKGGLRFTDP